MVLGSAAQYKRHDNVDLEEEGILDEDRRGSREEIISNEIIGYVDQGAGASIVRGAGVGDQARGGRVRLVDSTVQFRGGQKCRVQHPSNRGVWSSRSDLEKGLIISCAALFAFSTLLTFIVVEKTEAGGGGGGGRPPVKHSLHVTADKRGIGGDVCLSRGCVKVASTVLTTANWSADPCDDFYTFSCGGWEQRTALPDGRSSWSAFDKLWEANQLIMKNALEHIHETDEAGDHDEDGRVTGAKAKLHLYYDSCIDRNGTIEQLKGKPLLDLLTSADVRGLPLINGEDTHTINDTESFQVLIVTTANSSG